MAKKSKDEEYLDSLLNSVTDSNSQSNDKTDDFDKWFEEELNSIDSDEIDFDKFDVDNFDGEDFGDFGTTSETKLNEAEYHADEESNRVLDDASAEISDEVQNAVDDENNTVEIPEINEVNMDTSEVKGADLDIPEMDEINMDAPEMEEQNIENLEMKEPEMEIPEMEEPEMEIPEMEETKNDEENTSSTIKDILPKAEDVIKDIKEDNNDIDINNISDDDDLDDLLSLLDSYDEELSDIPDKSDSTNSEKTEGAGASNDGSEASENVSQTETSLNENISEAGELPQADDVDKIEIPDEADMTEKPKKKSFLSKLFSKKDKKNKEEADTISEADAILDETGSAFDDLALDAVVSAELSGNIEGVDGIEGLDNIPDKTEEEDGKKKKKKEKKKKEKKEKPPKKKKEKKEKRPPRRDEIIKIQPIFVLLSISVIALIVVGLLFGGKEVWYNSKVDKATSYYVSGKYSKAYNLLAGMDMKANDKDFYLQVENVMRVEKNINDFNAYIEVKKYTFALEALVKGVKDYDKYYDKGRELGTTEILDTKLDEIDTLLKNYYGISVDDARSYNLIDDSSEFSRIINEKALEINIPTEEGTQK